MYVSAGSAFCESLDGSTICTTTPLENHTRPSEVDADALKEPMFWLSSIERIIDAVLNNRIRVGPPSLELRI